MRLQDALRMYAEQRRGECPTGPEIAAYVDRGADYDRIADHLSCCSACVEAVRHELAWRRILCDLRHRR